MFSGKLTDYETYLFEDPASLWKYEQEWNVLVALQIDNHPFNSVRWILAWYQAFEQEHQFKLLVTIHKPSEQIVCMIPMVNQKGKWQMAAYDRSDYAPLALNPMHPESLIQTIKWASKQSSAVILNRLRTSSFIPLVKHLPNTTVQKLWQRLTNGYIIKHQYYDGAPKIDASFVKSNYLLSRNHLRKWKELSKTGTLNYVHSTTASDIQPRLDTLFTMHQEEWNNTHSPSLFNDKRARLFYELFSTELIHPNLSLDMLLLDDRPIAMHLGFENKDWVFYYKPTYNKQYMKQSAGRLLLHCILNRTHDVGKSFDFLIGTESYKLDYANRLEQLGDFRFVASKHRYQTSNVK